MKHFYTLILFCFGISFTAHAQWSFSMAKQGSGNGYDDANAITYDNQNNFYVTGYFASDSITFGTTTLYNQGMSDVYIVKYDIQLNFLWAISIGGPGDEYGLGISCDSSNNLVVVGNFSSPYIVMGNDTLTNAGSGTPDMFIGRFDVNGNFLWGRRVGCTNWDNCAGVDMSMSGDIFVCGAYYLDDLYLMNDTFVNRGGYDMILMRFDLNGNCTWAQSAGGNFNDLGNAVAYDTAGYVYVSGGFASDSLPFLTDTLINPMGGMPEIFVAKYTVGTGQFIWSRRAGSNDNDHSVAVDVDRNGNVYVGGHYHSAYFTFAGDTLFNQGMGDVFLLLYDSNGNELWGRTAGGADNDFGHGLFYSPYMDMVMLTGMYMSSSITFGWTTHNNAMPGMEDLFVTMYDATGYEAWSFTAGDMGRDYANAITVAGNTLAIYGVGSFSSNTLLIGVPLNNTDVSGNTSEAMIFSIWDSDAILTQASGADLHVYPNPGNGIFNFSSAIEGNAEVKVYNSFGQEVQSQENVSARRFEIDLTDQASGVYFYSIITSSGEVKSGKLVKE